MAKQPISKRTPARKTCTDFPTFDANDLALLSFACGHALNWYKKGRSNYAKAERAKYKAVNHKLSQVLNAFEYYHEAGDLTSVDEEGNTPIYSPNAAARRLARKAAKKRGATDGFQ